MSGFDYGNARVRSRRPELLDEAAYHALARAGDIDGMLAELAEGPYGPEVEAAVPRVTGLRRLDEVVRSHVARQMSDVTGFYPEEIASRLELLRRRWDIRNLRTILRAAARRVPGDDVTPMLIPTGGIDDAVLSELASRSGVRETVELMATWHIPSRAGARALVAALPDFESSGQVAGLEDVLQRAFTTEVADILDAGPEDELAGLLRSEIDLDNLLTALRLHTASAEGESVDPTHAFLPGGRIPSPALEAAARADTERETIDTIGRLQVPGWEAALQVWAADHHDLVRLTDELEEALMLYSTGWFRSSDPLGVGIPVAFITAKETEARNLRWVGRGLVHAFQPEEIADRLVVTT